MLLRVHRGEHARQSGPRACMQLAVLTVGYHSPAAVMYGEEHATVCSGAVPVRYEIRS